METVLNLEVAKCDFKFFLKNSRCEILFTSDILTVKGRVGQGIIFWLRVKDLNLNSRSQSPLSCLLEEPEKLSWQG